MERFAACWDDLLALVPGRVDYRVLVVAGRVVAFYAIEAQLARDGAVVLALVGIEIDIHGLDAPDEDESS